MADEVLAVEAVPLEEDFDALVASLAIDDTLEDKLAKLKKNVDEKLADYVDVKRIEKDEDFKAAKKYRAAVNDVKKPIEAQRKAAKKKYSDLLKTFDKTIGEITAPIDKLSDEYKAEIDRYDGECRKRRLTALKGHYYDLAGEMGPLVPYERIADDRWLNASFGEVKAKNIIERRVGELLHQFKFVNGLDYTDESEKAWAVAWWTRTLPADSGEVAAAVAAHREEVAKAAALVSTYEQATVPQPEPEPEPEPGDPFGGPRCVRVVPSRPEPDVAEDAAPAPQRGYRVVIECATADELRRVSGLGYMQGPRLVAFIKNNMTAKEDGQ